METSVNAWSIWTSLSPGIIVILREARTAGASGNSQKITTPALGLGDGETLVDQHVHELASGRASQRDPEDPLNGGARGGGNDGHGLAGAVRGDPVSSVDGAARGHLGDAARANA